MKSFSLTQGLLFWFPVWFNLPTYLRNHSNTVSSLKVAGLGYFPYEPGGSLYANFWHFRKIMIHFSFYLTWRGYHILRI